MDKSYGAILDRLLKRLEADDFKGYDPYDILLSPIPFRLFGTYAAAVATQLHKRNPVNIRPLLGIKKGHNPKAMGLLLYVYSRLQQRFPDRDYRSQLSRLFEYLKTHVSPGYHGACWGYNFPWASPGKYLPAFAPNAVVTSFVTKGLFEYYRLTKDPGVSSLLLSAAEFVRCDLPVYEDTTGRCISYTPFKKDICYNAALLAAEVLARAYVVSGEEALRSEALSVARFVLARQQSDGRWNYSQDPLSGQERSQVDFHQGFVLDSLKSIQHLTGITLQAGEEAIKRGVRFYKEYQFHADGSSYWRYPDEFPIDIHHQAQGIITFSIHDREVASTILNWTLNNLYDDRNDCFYYRKHRFLTDKTSYVRWGNAWMAVALTEMLTA